MEQQNLFETMKQNLKIGALLMMGVMAAWPGEQAVSQDDGDNLVPNGSFENADLKRLKKPGELELYCEDWFAATAAPLDLYAEGVKSEKVSLPNNERGNIEPAEGMVCAGFNAYTKDPRSSRTYFEVELNDQLSKNQLYCVSFDISLADMSRYAVNGIGAVLSDRKLTQNNTGLMVRDADVIHETKKVHSFRDGWETVCGTVIGTGQEEFLIIGNFMGDRDVDDEKMGRPTGASGSQTNDAYYFLDNVKVYPITAKSQCVCSAAAEVKEDLVYGASFAVDENMKPSDVVSGSSVYYAFLKRSPTAAGTRTVNQLVALMKENPSMRVRVVGHADDDEFNEGKINARYKGLGEKRADYIVRLMTEQGIGADRVEVEARENTDPASTRDTEISRAQNRRVTFEVIR
ncbi:MAG: OmpA family protein [Flavobacteriales bacterium]